MLAALLLSAMAPSVLHAQAIGTYANGCVAETEALPEQGLGYQSIRRDRNRYWGHPALIDWIKSYGKRLDQEGASALIGDIGLRKGGPIPDGHGSHQIGLDVDIWLRPGPLSATDLANPIAISMVRPDLKDVSGDWSKGQAHMIRLAAQSPEVERIFVNPAIKQALCRDRHKSDDAWLRKIRPWWGHDAHFHVRLSCPKDSPDCQKQSPIPEGDGCGEDLQWWFSEEAKAPPSKSTQKPILPQQCQAILRSFSRNDP